ncbi:MAG: hypothetical protein AAFV88_08700 [Planctomycetota bacterium]
MTNQLQMQPTFHVTLPWPREEAKRRLRAAISSDELGSVAESAGWVLDYKVQRHERRFWSPHLSVQLDEPQAGVPPESSAPHSSEAHCRFSPRPEIWTMVMAVYMVAACCFFGALVFGFVQWMMDNPPWALVVLPCSILTIVGLHFASLVGQGWSRDQMEDLRKHWDRTVEIARELPNGSVKDDAKV